MLGLNINRKVAHDTTKLMLYAVNRYDKVITNRLHVAVLAYRLGKDIELFNNSYGKVYDIAKWSIMPNYQRCKPMDEINEFPRKMTFNDLFEHSFVIARDVPRYQDVENTLNSIGIYPKKWQAVEYYPFLKEVPRWEYG